MILGHPGNRTTKNIEKITFLDPILEHFWAPVFQLLGYGFKVCFQKTQGPPFVPFWNHLETQFGTFFVTFSEVMETSKIEAPLARNQCFSSFDYFFDTFFNTPTRTTFLPTVHRFGSLLGLPFRTFGQAFWRRFFRSQKSEMPILVSTPGGSHLRPLREKGGTGKHLGGYMWLLWPMDSQLVI